MRNAFLITASLVLVSSLAYANGDADAQAERDEALGRVPTTWAKPCSYWSYNTSGGHTCQSYEFSVKIPDGDAVNYELSRLEERIRRLEAKSSK